jgi:mannitol/fructose-specific phosphotransferase system IIA component (Ntr-type)
LIRKNSNRGDFHHDPVFLALAFSSIYYEAHTRAISEAIQLLSDEEYCRKIIESLSPIDVMEKIALILE